MIPSSLPMAVPLEQTGQAYQYIVYNPSCTSAYYHGSFTDPVNPTYLTLTSGASQAVVYNVTNVTGACNINTAYTANTYQIICAASDPSSEVFQYNLKIFNETNVLGSTQTVVSETFNTPTFNYNIIVPSNETYSYSLYADAFKSVDPVFLVNGGPLSFTPATLAPPLLGIFAFILVFAAIMIGIQAGKSILVIAFVSGALFVISIMNLVQISTAAAVVFIVIGVVFSFWSIRNR